MGQKRINIKSPSLSPTEDPSSPLHGILWDVPARSHDAHRNPSPPSEEPNKASMVRARLRLRPHGQAPRFTPEDLKRHHELQLEQQLHLQRQLHANSQQQQQIRKQRTSPSQQLSGQSNIAGSLREPADIQQSPTPTILQPQAPQMSHNEGINQNTPTLITTPFQGQRNSRNATILTEVSLKIQGIPSYWTLLELFQVLNEFGSVDFLEIFESIGGTRNPNGWGRVRFVPPPQVRFWENNSLDIPNPWGKDEIKLRFVLEDPRPLRTVPSPVNPNKLLPETFAFPAYSLDFGVMYSPNQMMTMFRIQGPVRFEVNLQRRYIDIKFKHWLKAPKDATYRKLISGAIKDSRIDSWEREESYRFRIRFEHLRSGFLEQPMKDKNTRTFVIPLTFPPEFFRKLHDPLKSFTDPKERIWSEWDTWFRQTGITYFSSALMDLPTTLRQPFAEIDIGRWTTYRFSFQLEERQRTLFDDMLNALKDFNVETSLHEDFELLPHVPASVWELIDAPPAAQHSLEVLRNTNLTFPVRYQLESCISFGYLSEYNLDSDFVQRLIELPQHRALAILESVAEKKIRVYNPMEIFTWNGLPTHTAGMRIENYCVIVRTAVITPTTINFNAPSVEYSNRVLRQYREHADKFLRIKFRDDDTGRVQYQRNACKDDVFTRIHNTLRNGITIGDRHFEFLAFGSSQFREHGAYMFASDQWIKASEIRDWMGDFSDIRVVGKYCARLGQCFSATRSIAQVHVRKIHIEEVKRNGRKFSDGVGLMSEFVARMAADDLKLSGREPPSAFQFRLGGCKGVLTVDPGLAGSTVAIRPSQEKFTSDHNTLEVIRPATFASASLNRQLILVLSALEVPGYVFEQMLSKQIDELKDAMTDANVAINKLTKQIDEHQMTLALASMIRDGFMHAREPFFMNLLHLWRAFTHKGLKEKTKINVEEGAFLLGIMDETGILKGHFDTNEEQTDEQRLQNLPEIFCQVSDFEKPGQFKVCEGVCIIARNPSLHPGDIRVVRAVDVPKLRHLRDVLVLPQTGDYDLAGMCSGGDLDGDDYIICWDKRLIPPVVNYEPMNYQAPPDEDLERDVRVSDMISFFVNYMKTDRLGHIANTHTVWADQMESGVLDPKCIELAQLHSTAVDYPKTGREAVMPRRLRPRQYPHFMEKKNGEKIYTSRHILGRLYDMTERIDFHPVYTLEFDDRILNNAKFAVSDRLLRSAKAVKLEYDTSVRRILGQYDIRTEYEIYSTFVLNHKSSGGSDYSFHEEIERVSQSLRERFRSIIYEKVGGKNKLALGSYVVAMYKVTYQEMMAAFQRQPSKDKGFQDPSRMPLISFPWIFREILGKLCNGEMPYNGKVEHDPPTIGTDGRKEQIENLPDLDFDETDRVVDKVPGVDVEDSSGQETSHDEDNDGRLSDAEN